MHEIVMTDADRDKADQLKNAILDLCLQRKVSTLVALSATRCAAEGLEELINEQGGEVFTVTAPPDTTRVAGEHPEDFCHKCGHPNISWFAPNQLWNEAVRAVNQPEILCPVCFVKLTEIAGIREQTWEVAPKNWHAGETQESRTTALR